MAERIILRKPGQNKIARYRHTQSCIRLAGFAPGRERERELFRCRVLAAVYLLMILAGTISVFR